MGVEFQSQAFLHYFFLDFSPIWTAWIFFISSQFEGLRRSFGIDNKMFFRFPFVFFALEVVFRGRIDYFPHCKWGRVEIAHEPISIVGSIEANLICLHYFIEEA